MKMKTTDASHASSSLPQGASWYAQLSPQGKRAFAASFGGWIADAFDFMVFTFVMATLIGLWHLDRSQAGMLSTVTLICSAIGGWVAGLLADRYGRVKVLQGTILWFSACTFAIGFAQNFEQIFVLRALQGFGFGGEWAVGAVLVGEIVSPAHRGKAVGLVQSGWAIGWGAAALLYSVAFSILPESIAWRSLFWFSILPALLVLYIRKNVSEPAVFVQVQAAKKQRAEKNTIWAIFKMPLLPRTVLAAMLCTGIQGGFYAMSTWLPTLLKLERNLSVLNTGGYLLVIIFGSFCGYMAGAFLSDYVGRRANFILFAVLSLVSVFLYMTLPLTNTEMLWLGFPLGFSSCGIFSGTGAYLTELFPSECRASGQSFTYNFGRGVGALFPLLVGMLSHSVGLATGIAIFSGIAYGTVILVVLLLPETKGVNIEALQKA